MTLAHDDHVVQTLAPDGSDPSLCIRILPRAGRTGDNLAYAHAGDAAPEHVATDGVAIPQQPSRCRAVRERFNHLLRRPRSRGMFRDVDIDDSAALLGEQDHTNSTWPVRVGTVKKSIDASVGT